MAEVGLVASVFGIASLGASVSKVLFDLGYTMRHAREQIEEIASEVTTFTAIIKELGAVVEAHHRFLSEEAKKMVGQTMIDCKKVFTSIKRQIRRKRDAEVGPVRWLFKRRRAEELRRKMDTLKSFLSLMLQVVQVGQKIQSRQEPHHLLSVGILKNCSEAIPNILATLRDDIQMLKNEVLNYHRSLPKLREAEQDLALATAPEASRESDTRPGPLRLPKEDLLWLAEEVRLSHRSPPSRQADNKSTKASGSRTHPILFGKSPRPGATGSEQDMAGPHADMTTRYPPTAGTDAEAKHGQNPVSGLNPKAEAQESQPPTQPSLSSKLIAAMPYNPTTQTKMLDGPQGYRIGESQPREGSKVHEEPPAVEATKALKTLMVEWTRVTPRLILDVFGEENDDEVNSAAFNLEEDDWEESESEMGEDDERDDDGWTGRHHPPTGETPYGINASGASDPSWGRGISRIAGEKLPLRRDAWRVPEPQFMTLAKILSIGNARFTWVLRDEFRIVFMVDNQACLTYDCVVGDKAWTRREHMETLVPKQWVLQDVIQLFGHVAATDESWDGYWLIKTSLNHVDVRRLVETSSHVFERRIRRISFAMMKNPDNVNYGGWPDEDVEPQVYKPRGWKSKTREAESEHQRQGVAYDFSGLPPVPPFPHKGSEHMENTDTGLDDANHINEAEDIASDHPSQTSNFFETSDAAETAVERIPHVTNEQIRSEIERLERDNSDRKHHRQTPSSGRVKTRDQESGSHESSRRRKHRDRERDRDRDENRDGHRHRKHV